MAFSSDQARPLQPDHRMRLRPSTLSQGGTAPGASRAGVGRGDTGDAAMRPVDFPVVAETLVQRTPAQAAAKESMVVDLRGLFAVLRRRTMWILVAWAACIAAALAVALLTPPRYSATAQLLIDPRDLRVVRSESVLRSEQPDPNQLSEVESALGVMQSAAVLLRVVESEGLDSDPEFAGAAARGEADSAGLPERVNRALTALGRHLSVKRADRSFVVDVSVWSTSPDKAKRLADAVAQAYLDQDGEVRALSTGKAASDVASRLAELAARVQDAERKVEDYKVENNIVVAGGRLVSEQQLSEISAQLVLARARTSEQQARYEQVQRLQRMPLTDVSALDALDSPAMAQLRSRYADVLRLEADIRARLGPRHPDVISIAAQTAEMRRAVAQELARYVATVRQDYERSRASEASLTAKLDDLKRQVTETGGASVRLRALERNAEASRVVYASFLSRSGELNEQRGINTSSARFISRALRPQVPSGTSKALIMAGGAVVGLMLGLGLAILRDQTDDRLFDRRQVEQASGLPVVAELPRRKTAVPGALAMLPGLHRVTQGWAQRARSSPYVVLFVGAGASSDKGTIAYDLAIAGHVNLGPALLVDGDLRNGVLSRRLGVSAPGSVAGVLLDDEPLATSLVADTETGLKMLPSTGGSGATALSSAVTGRLTAAARDFGVIIVDAASPLQDPTVFGFIGAADEILLVCQAGRTRRAELADSLQALGVTGPKVTGILLA